MKSIKNLKNLKNKIILLRTDFNVPLKKVENRLQIIDDLRIIKTLPTIKYLLGKGAKIIIVSHFNKKISSKILIPILKRYFGKNIYFVKNPFVFNFCTSKEKLFLLENIRKWPEEEKNDAKFARKLAALADIYVNDAFGVCHRNHASVSAITRFIPSYAGFLIEEEIKNLNKAKKGRHPLIVVLGGAKISTKLPLIKSYLSKAHSILVGGGIANNFFYAKEISVGKSKVDKNFINKKIINNKKIILPQDVIVAKNIYAKNGITKNHLLIEKDDYILDIGPKTIKKFCEIIKNAKTIICNGPLGFIENKTFARGTRRIIEAIIKNKKAFSVLGGGETLSIIPKKYKSPIANIKNMFISTGGGAMLNYLASKKLPGIEALKIKI